MEVWQDQLHDMLDQAAVYAEDWPECLDMLAEAHESKELHEFLELLVPRLKRMQRRFNQVEYSAKEQWWRISNYTYSMYRYMKRYDPVATPNRLVIPDNKLTAEDREKLRAQL